MMKTIYRLAACVLVTGWLAPLTWSQDEKVELDKIPEKVMATLKTKFPGAKITTATKATENNEVIYDIEMTKDGKKCECDLKADGTIVNFEHELAVKDLPAAVVKAVKDKHPNCTLKESMTTYVIKDGKDVIDGYEVLIDTADKKEVELTVSPDGSKIE
jgi:hypothetical protein